MEIKYVSAVSGKRTHRSGESGFQGAQKRGRQVGSASQPPATAPPPWPSPRRPPQFAAWEWVSPPPPAARSRPPPGPRGAFLGEPRFCAVNGASAKAGAGRERNPGPGAVGTWPRGRREARPLSARTRGLERVPIATAPPLRWSWTTRCSPGARGSAPPLGSPRPTFPAVRAGKPGGKWSELTTAERAPCQARRVTRSGDPHSAHAPPRLLEGSEFQAAAQ